MCAGSRETQRNYIRDVSRFATFLGRSPDTATPEDVRQFQIEQRESGVPTPTMNSIVSALRFFFTQTIDRPDLARKLVRAAHPRNLPVVLSRGEVVRLLNATTTVKYQAALSVAYGAGLRVAEVAALKVSPMHPVVQRVGDGGVREGGVGRIFRSGSRLGLEEFQQVSVDHVGMCGRHAMRKARIGLERRFF
jgi:site-specific recombinase XerD